MENTYISLTLAMLDKTLILIFVTYIPLDKLDSHHHSLISSCSALQNTDWDTWTKPVDRPETGAMEGSGKSDGLESGQMQTSADLWAVFRGRVRPSGDGLPGGYWSREVPTQMKEQYGAGAEADLGARSGSSGRIPSFVFFSFPFCSGLGGSII